MYKKAKPVLLFLFIVFSISSRTTLASTTFASFVVDHSPVSGPSINTPEELLGAPDGEITAFEEVDISTPGYVVVGFSVPFLNISGDDITIHLSDWIASENEVFEVFASQDGSLSSFFSLGTSGTPNGGVHTPITATFDLGIASMDWALFLRIENLVIHPLEGEGPDIDAIEANAVIPVPSALFLGMSGLASLVISKRKR